MPAIFQHGEHGMLVALNGEATSIVTEEWLSFFKSEPKPASNIQFWTIPNVIPSEKGRSKDFMGFVEAPVESLLDGPRFFLSFWPMSATVFSIIYHHQLLLANGHFEANLKDYLSWLDDQPKDSVLYISQGSFLSVSNEQLDEIIEGVHISSIPTFWVSRDGVGNGNRGIAVPFCDQLRVLCHGVGNGNRGIAVPWCDQLRVLCHPSVGGFWSHCGWNSTKEGAFAGVPFLTFPIAADQVTNSKLIVEDWKIGWRLNNESENLIKRDEIALLVQRFMELDSNQGREMRRRAMEIRKICREAIEGGAVEGNIDKFIRDISQVQRR
ncbi:hypothetical protein RND71_019770 [Anisodus tanguticus]|uniref:Uncharacterized protein n=1 Tax=Anisodus tanguticus TaxID=243964 RepID=A0AAE1V8R7_9SOLA|nr:hypothetical protein RND71_019770 [Anisodus tanguticus]